MSRAPPSSSKLPDDPLAARQRTTLTDLPNELLILIVELLGPPDISCCDPGWLVIPAVCRRLQEVAGKITAWDSGEVAGPGGVSAEYGWRELSWSEKRLLPAGTPNRTFWTGDGSISLSYAPRYKGGSVEYLRSALNVTSKDDQNQESQDGLEAIDRFFGGVSLNLSWVSSIDVSFQRPFVPHQDCSFMKSPCIIAPALQELRLSRYVVDWRCNRLRKLTIDMGWNGSGDTPSNYRYPPAQLFARLRDSRLALEQVQLDFCLQSVPKEASHGGPIPVHEFPRLHKFEITDAPNEVNSLCRQIGFPAGYAPLINATSSDAIGSLRSLACGYASSVPYPKPALPGFHGELDALTFRESNEYDGAGCLVTASRIDGVAELGLRDDPDFSYTNLEVYAQRHTARYIDYDSEQDVRILEGKVPGIEPVFIADLGWSPDAWSAVPSDDDACGSRCSALHGIKHVFLDGIQSRLMKPEFSAQVWTNVLRQLPNVRHLYIYAPSAASLAPLINEPDLLPELRSLWLGRDNHTNGDVDNWYNYESGGESDRGPDTEINDASDSDGDDGWDDDGDDSTSGGRPKHHGPLKTKVDAGLLLGIFKRREQMGKLDDFELSTIRIEIVGDMRDIHELENVWGLGPEDEDDA